MKHLKYFEEIKEITDEVNIGYVLASGQQGVLISPKDIKKIPSIIKGFKERNIKYRIFIDENILILIDKNDIEKLPFIKDEYGLRDYYISDLYDYRFGLGWFYQDIFDDYDWKEVTINNDEDMNELEAYISSVKYNL